MPDVSVLLPVYNESEILEEHAKKIAEHVKKVGFECEVIIVDDASSDESVKLEAAISQKYGVRFIRYEQGPTRRENLAQSFKQAKGDIIVMMDFDLATDLNQLKVLIEEVKKGADIVTGNRYHKESRLFRKWDRWLVSKVMNGIVQLLFNTGLTDNFCGFKAFKKKVAIKLVKEMGFDDTKKRGVCWDPELLARARLKGLKVTAIPITWIERKKSALHFCRLSEIQSLFYLLKLKARLRKSQSLKGTST